LYNLLRKAGTLLCAVSLWGMLFDDVNKTEVEEGGISGGVVFPPLSVEEESLLFLVIFFFFKFVEGVVLLLCLIDVIKEEPESDELAVENKLVEGDPEESVDEEEE
jgi:hypothetical protein